MSIVIMSISIGPDIYCSMCFSIPDPERSIIFKKPNPWYLLSSSDLWTSDSSRPWTTTSALSLSWFCFTNSDCTSLLLTKQLNYSCTVLPNQGCLPTTHSNGEQWCTRSQGSPERSVVNLPVLYLQRVPFLTPRLSSPPPWASVEEILAPI